MGKELDEEEGGIETPLLITENGKAYSDAGTDSTDVTVHGASMYMGVDKSSLLSTGDEGLTSKEAERRLALFGRNELKDEKTSPFIKLLKSFIAPIPIMIWIAIVVEAVEKDWPDFGVLFVLQVLNAVIGWYEELKAGNAIEALKASLQPVAIVKRDGQVQKLDAALLVPGDRVVLNAGGAVPSDCIVSSRDVIIEVDQASLTGESLPVPMSSGDTAKMGSTVVRGECEAVVCATGSQTFFGKTAAMISSVDELSNFQKVLLRITLFLMILSFILVGVCLGYLLSQGEDVLDAIAFSVVLLVASIPIAMQMVCTSTMALGCRKLAEKKAIVSRLAAVEELAAMSVLCSDKTGTLTMNKMSLQDCIPYAEGYDRESILRDAALAAKWTEPAKDALDTLVLSNFDVSALDAYEQIDYMPFDPKVKRTESTVQLKDGSGKMFKVTKGAPQVILNMCANKDSIKEEYEARITDLARRGIRALSIAKGTQAENGEYDFQVVGLLTFLDPPRPDTKQTIEDAYAHGVQVKMITGDQKAIAVEMCRILGMGQNVLGTENLPSYEAGQAISKSLGKDYGTYIEGADGFAQVYPEHKFLIVEALRQKGYIVGMTGDGVNDAPALKKADVGIAVEGATDAARASADIVLTEPGLSTIVHAIILSRKIFARMKNYVIYRIACTIQLLVFFFLAVLAIHPWSVSGCEKDSSHDYCKKFRQEHGDDHIKYFKLPVIALVMITILNDGTIISIAYDHVEASQEPEVWNLHEVFATSTLLGLVAMASSILLLCWGLESNKDDSVFYKLGLERLSYGQVMTMMYLKISLSDFLTVFAARTKSFFWSRKPAIPLFAAFCFATITSTVFARTWPFKTEGDTPMEKIDGSLCILVWMYCIVWFLLQDTLKVFLDYLMDMYLRSDDSRKSMKKAAQLKMRRKKTDKRAGLPSNIQSQFPSSTHPLITGGEDLEEDDPMTTQRLAQRVKSLEEELLKMKALMSKNVDNV